MRTLLGVLAIVIVGSFIDERPKEKAPFPFPLLILAGLGLIFSLLQDIRELLK